ncbi:MAG: ABC transporter permease [Pseudomonadota bacterium]
MTETPQEDRFEGAAARDGEVARFAHGRTVLDRAHHVLHANPTAAPLIVLAASLLAFGTIADNFFTAFNLSLIMQQVMVIGILGISQTLIILTAGIDLSIAAVMMLSAVVMGRLGVLEGWPTGLAILAGFITGMAAGALNGLLVTRFRLPPFIVTLGTWLIFYALLLWYSEAQTIRSQDVDTTAPLLKFWGQRIGIQGAQFAYGTVLMLGLFGLVWYMLNWTAWGRAVYAVGDDKDAAELAGIRTDRVLLSVYAAAGLVAAIAGWVSIGRIGSVSPQSFYEGNLDAITAVVIGGTSLFGGRGAIFGTLIGALIVGVFRSGLALSGVDVLWQTFAVGVLIIVAVAVDQWIRRVSA